MADGRTAAWNGAIDVWEHTLVIYGGDDQMAAEYCWN
jgi:hypothetical protein